METKTTVMPIKIEVLRFKQKKVPSFVQFYTKDGKPFLKMQEEYKLFDGELVDFDQNLYIELLSIQTAENARSFTEQHPDLRFALYQQPCISIGTDQLYQLGEYETADRYYTFMADAIKQYRDHMKLIPLLHKYEMKPSKKDRDRLLKYYKQYFKHVHEISSPLQSFGSLYGDRLYYYENIEARERFEEELKNGKVTFSPIDLEKLNESTPIPVDEDGVPLYNGFPSQEALNKYHEELDEQARISLAQDATKDFRLYFDRIINNSSKISFANNSTIDRLCAKPTCHNYFKVNKSHRQTLCDTHMAPRRRKRKKQQEKQKEEERKSWEYFNTI